MSRRSILREVLTRNSAGRHAAILRRYPRPTGHARRCSEVDLLENVTKRHGEQVTVDRVSLEVETGELFVLLGASGSGKSTVLRMIAGLVAPDEGVIRLSGTDVTLLAAAAARRRLRVPELLDLPPHDRRRRTSSSACASAASPPRRGSSAAKSCSSSSASAASETATRASSRAASGSASRSRAPSPTSRPCCSSTSPSAPSTSRSGRSCARA